MSGAGPVTGELTVPSAEGMRALGRRLAGLLRAGDLVILSGALGAGKTTLVQGIAAGMRVRGPVTSPTFVIARVHPALACGPDLVHADAYRLASPAEVDDLDLDASLDRSVTVVEWGGGLAEGLAADRLEVTITLVPEEPDGSAGGGTAAQDGGAGSGPAAQDGGAGGGPAAVDGGAGGGPEEPGDQPRRVRVTGFGGRWESAPESAFLASLTAPGAV